MDTNTNTNEILLHNILRSTNNYINSYNNSINYLNSANNYLNSANNNIMTVLLNNYYCYNNYLNTSNNSNNNSNNSNSNSDNITNNNTNTQNAYLLNYTLEDYENLSIVNMKALIKISTAQIHYCCIALPLNETCPITQEEFSSNDQVTIIKNCGHIFNTHAVTNWLYQHQTCPVCRYNILTNSKLISYINPANAKKLFLYSNEFRFYLALHIENLLTNRDNTHSTSDTNDDTNTNRSEQNTYEFGLFLR